MRLWFSGPRIGFFRPGVSFNLGRRGGARPTGSAPSSGEYVYVIQGEHGHVKVGISTDPAARLATLQTGSSARLALAWSEFAGERAFEVEQQAHAMLAPQRLAGEWFDTPKEAAIGAVYGAAYRLGITLGGVTPDRGLRWSNWYILLIGIAGGAFAGAATTYGLAETTAVAAIVGWLLLVVAMALRHSGHD